MSEFAPEALSDLIAKTLDDGKAQNIRVLDVRRLTTITDYMVVASGRTARQVKALTNRVLEAARHQKVRPLGVEGENVAEWVLIDFGDVIVHTMQPQTRAFYQLEKLWDNPILATELAGEALES